MDVDMTSIDKIYFKFASKNEDDVITNSVSLNMLWHRGFCFTTLTVGLSPHLPIQMIGFSLSPGGLLLPYHLGVLDALQYHSFLDDTTPIAGSSAGTCIVVARGSLNVIAAVAVSLPVSLTFSFSMRKERLPRQAMAAG
jgi:hypothetical protein